MTNTNASMLLKFLILHHFLPLIFSVSVGIEESALVMQLLRDNITLWTATWKSCQTRRMTQWPSLSRFSLVPLSHWSSCLLAFACLDFVSSLPWLSDIFALFIEVFHWSLNGFDTATTSAASDCAGHRIQVDGRESFTVGVVQPHRTPSDRKPYQAVISAKDRCLNLI